MDGKLEGKLARSWELSEDYRSWTVNLNKDVRWHEGVPVTAADIAFTVELPSRADVGYIAPGTIDITIIDGSTLVYTSTLNLPLPDYQAFCPKHLLGGT